MRPIVLRPARRRDVEGVATIEQRAFADPWSSASFASLVSEPRVLFTVLEADGRVIGYTVVWTAADEADLANIAVASELRGRGFGRLLLDGALAAARGRGAAAMYLEVRESNAVAQALYASRGFQLVGHRRRYYRNPVEDALVLRAMLASLAGAEVR